MIADGRRGAARIALIAGVVFSAACGNDDPSGPRRVATSLAAETPIAVAGMVATPLSPGATVIVRDQNGDGIAGVTVTFTPGAGSGTVERQSVRTSGAGVATPGRWTLGNKAGSQRLIARVQGLDSVVFTATVAPGAPVMLAAPSVSAQTATVGSLAPASVFALDEHGNPIAGLAVSFEVRSGGGVATGTTTLTDADGVARVGSWTLGTRAGLQTLAARMANFPETVLSVDAIADEAEVVRLIAGSDQISVVGTRLETAPRVSVRDRYDNPVARRAVAVSGIQGGGTVSGTLLTDDAGLVSLDGWTVGPAEGLNSVTITVDGLPLTIFAKAVPLSGYDIQFRYLTEVSATQRLAFERAAERWRKVIVGDLPSIFSNRSTHCGVAGSGLNESIDDLIIFVRIEPIDGAGRVLGSAGPCLIRPASGLTSVGAMRFDVDDIAVLEQSDRFENVVLHEIGHILGVGTLWDLYGFLADSAGPDPYYTGASGRAGFAAAGGAAYAGTPVPVENTGGSGTRNSHWRENILNAEIMTGFVEAPGVRMPLSLTTIGTLEDMGYLVTRWGDDPYAYAGAAQAGISARGRFSVQELELIEVPFPPPEVGNSSGGSSPISAHVVRPPVRRGRVTGAEPAPVQQLEVRRPR